MRYLTALRQYAVACTVRMDHDLLIVSPGGVGTTFMLEFFGKHLRCNHPHDKDYLKHLPCPPKRYSPSTRFLYIYGEPDRRRPFSGSSGHAGLSSYEEWFFCLESTEFNRGLGGHRAGCCSFWAKLCGMEPLLYEKSASGDARLRIHLARAASSLFFSGAARFFDRGFSAHALPSRGSCFT